MLLSLDAQSHDLELDHTHSVINMSPTECTALLKCYHSVVARSACAFHADYVHVCCTLVCKSPTALADKKRQSDQGWSYANSYNRSTNSFCSNSSPSVEEWPSPPAQQHHVLSTSGSGDSYVQEVKSSDTEE